MLTPNLVAFGVISMSIIKLSVCSLLVSVWAAAQAIPLPSSEATPPQPSQRSLPHSESGTEPGLQILAGSAGHDAPGSGTQTCGQSHSHPPSQSSQVGKHTAWTHRPTAVFAAAQVAKLLLSSSVFLPSSSSFSLLVLFHSSFFLLFFFLCSSFFHHLLFLIKIM